MEPAVKCAVCAVCSDFYPDHEPGFLEWAKIPHLSPRENNILFLALDSPPATGCSLKKYQQGCCLKYHLGSLCSQGFQLLLRLARSPHMKALPAFFQSISSISLWSLDRSPLPKPQISIPLWIPQDVVQSEVFGVKSFGVREQAFCTELVWCIWQDWGGTKPSLFTCRWIKYLACFHLFLGKCVLW